MFLHACFYMHVLHACKHACYMHVKHACPILRVFEHDLSQKINFLYLLYACMIIYIH
jgi:hypothetical protein